MSELGFNNLQETVCQNEIPFSAISRRFWLAAIICVAVMAALRVVALSSDVYAKLSWSTALLTDEGFYIHNARNFILFGHEKTDNFNNALIMPVLHYLQVLVFKLFGVGVIQARMISVVLSLMTLVVFYRTIYRLFGLTAAATATLFLGLDHINLLYNRMALMDTPAAFVMTIALCVFVQAYQISLSALKTPKSSKNSIRPNAWWILCGMLLVLSYVTRGVAALIIPAPFIVLWIAKDIPFKKGILPLFTGVIMGFIIYKVCWFSAHQAELSRMSRYYFSAMLIPHTVTSLYLNIRRGVVDPGGLFPYLFKHSGVQFLLALSCELLIFNRTWRSKLTRLQNAGLLFCGVWLSTAWLALFSINLAPSRYYVLYYPAMAALAGIAFSRPLDMMNLFRSSPFNRAFLTSFAVYYLLLTSDLIHNGLAQLLSFAFCVLVFGIMWRCKPSISFGKASSVSAVLLAAWFGLNFCWIFDWLHHLSYRQIEADQWLEAHLPPTSVLFGDVAPGLCINNHFIAVSVIPKLCNDDHPIERFQNVPRYIIILDDNRFKPRWKEQWWVNKYPELMRRENRIHNFSGLLRPFFTIGLYPVPNNEYTEIPAK